MHADRLASPTRLAQCRSAAAVALIALVVLAAPAGAAWHPPVDLSTGGQPAMGARVAVGPAGVAAAVWTTAAGVVQSALRPPGGGWQPAVDVSPAGQQVGSAQVAIAADGSVLAAWIGPEGVVRSAARPAGAAWQAPSAVAADRGAVEVKVAVDARGDAVAAWVADSVVRSASRPAGGVWQPAADLSTGALAAYQSRGRLHLAIGPGGDAAVAWVRGATPDFVHATVQSAVRGTGGAWQAQEDVIVGGAYTGAPVVAVDARGTAFLVWADRGVYSGGPVYAAVRPAGGRWEAPTALATSGSHPQVAIAASGDATAVWDTGGAGRYPWGSHIHSAVRPANGTWAQPVAVQATEGRAILPQIAIAGGDAFVLWTHHRVAWPANTATGPELEQDEDVVQGAVRPAGGAWQAPAVLSVPGVPAFTPKLAADPRGGAVAVWSRGSETDATVQSATYDPAFVAPPPPPPPPVPPALSQLRLSPRTFRAARSGPAVRATLATSWTRVSYTLDRAATVRFDIRRIRPGRRAGGSCLKPSRANRGRPSCERHVRVPGGFSRSRPAGGDRFTFSGRVAGRMLRPGRYALVATPAASGRTGTPVRTSLRIVR